MTSESVHGANGSSPADLDALSVFTAGAAEEHDTHRGNGHAREEDADAAAAGEPAALADSAVIDASRARARRLAADFKHPEVTFAHFMLALTQLPSACQWLRRRGADIEGMRSAAFAELAKLGGGTAPEIVESDELASVLAHASARARDRADDFQMSDAVLLKDVIDVVAQRDATSPARCLLAAREPSSLAGEVRALRSGVQDSLGAVSTGVQEALSAVSGELSRIDQRIGDIGQTTLQQVEGLFSALDISRDDRLKALVFELGSRIQHDVKDLVALLPPPIPTPVPTVMGRLLRGAAACIVGLALLAAGYALGSSGMGPKLMSWVMQFAA